MRVSISIIVTGLMASQCIAAPTLQQPSSRDLSPPLGARATKLSNTNTLAACEPAAMKVSVVGRDELEVELESRQVAGKAAAALAAAKAGVAKLNGAKASARDLSDDIGRLIGDEIKSELSNTDNDKRSIVAEVEEVEEDEIDRRQAASKLSSAVAAAKAPAGKAASAKASARDLSDDIGKPIGDKILAELTNTDNAKRGFLDTLSDVADVTVGAAKGAVAAAPKAAVGAITKGSPTGAIAPLAVGAVKGGVTAVKST